MADRSSSRIGKADVDRPVQFIVQVALAALWESWGVVPSRVVGDGIGEVAAAYVTGNISLEDAARIVAEPIQGTSRFSTTVAELANEGFDVFLEIGPHPVLASTIKARLGARTGSSLILPSLRRGDAGLESMRWSSAFLYARGFDLEWSRVSPPGRFVRLPNYPWQRERFWLDDGENRTQFVATPERDRDDAISIAAPHQNGHLNGCHSTPAKRSPAVVVNQNESAEKRPATLQNGVARTFG